ncbi:MAG TPA: DUF1761 domain-containing protein [Chitinophagaceae bacterium]|nr:DUF1761 domain-containing protein [Chitinophagaceae bacterium]
MNTTKILIGALIGAIVNFLAGWLVYGILLKDAMDKAMTVEAKAVSKPEPNLVGMFVAGFIFCLLFSYIFEQWAKIRSLMGGLVAGGLMGLCISLAFDIQFMSMLNMFTGTGGMIMDVCAGTVMSALTGAGIGWYLGLNRKEAV